MKKLLCGAGASTRKRKFLSGKRDASIVASTKMKYFNDTFRL
jgi:hypothetical protein